MTTVFRGHSCLINPNTFNPVWVWYTSEPVKTLFWIEVCLPALVKVKVYTDRCRNYWGLPFEIQAEVAWDHTQEAARVLKLFWDEPTYD